MSRKLCAHPIIRSGTGFDVLMYLLTLDSKACRRCVHVKQTMVSPEASLSAQEGVLLGVAGFTTVEVWRSIMVNLCALWTKRNVLQMD
jgi:hypothetical protein